MPLVNIKTISNGIRLALWQMTETEDELCQMVHYDFTDLQSHNRRRELLTECCLLYALTGDRKLKIDHQTSGKPLLPGFEVSISHTRGWAVMLLSENRPVGIDIEFFSDRVNRVVSRFIRADEQNDGVERRLINWSAKETVYKLLSDEDLQHFEMRLAPFTQQEEGNLKVEDLKQGGMVNVHYQINEDYVLTWAVL